MPGILAYFILSILSTPIRISVPLSIFISILVFGLTAYYFNLLPDTREKRKLQSYHISGFSNSFTSMFVLFVCIYGILLSTLVVTFVTNQEVLMSYFPWGEITPIDIIKIANAIAFSFFLPGYGILLLMDKDGKLRFPVKLLLAYLISMLLVALPTYAGASFGYKMTEIELFVIMLYAVIFILLLLQRQLKNAGSALSNLRFVLNHESISLAYVIKERYPELLVFASLFALVVFYTYYLDDGVIVVDQWFHHGRALLIGSGNYPEIASAEFYRDPYSDVGSDITQMYPPVFSSLLAGFFNLSNSASVNAYVSIGFLNFMPIVAFYYFFKSWVPQMLKNAALVATTLFAISSGFGWIYAVDLAILSPSDTESATELHSIYIIGNVTTLTYDIGLPTSFINVGHPDITTPLLIIALPAGFTLMGMIKEFVVKNGLGDGPSNINLNKNKRKELTTADSGRRYSRIIFNGFAGTTFKVTLLIILVSFLGILAHDEFYLFIIIACFAIVILLAISPYNRSLKKSKISFGNTFRYGYSTFFSSFLVAIFLVFLIDTIVSPINYYTSREIVGFSLLWLCFVFVLFSWLTYLIMYMTIGRRYSSIIRSVNPDSVSNNENDNAKPRGHIGWIGNRFDYIISKLKETSRSRKTENLLSISNPSSNVSNENSAKSKRNHRTFRLALSITITSILVFLYLFTFLVWSQLSIEDIQSQADTENEWNVPWYLYPMKLGLTGLLGLVFLLSYLFRKFEKEIFVFVLIAVIALSAGPYYDEHRFSKYIMAGMASLAALLIYEIISKARVHSASMPRHLAGVKYSMGSGSKLKVVVGGILLGLVVTFSSLSILVFAGFVELFTNVPDYNENTRRDFPTHSEMQLLDFLRVGFSAKNPDENYNIALPDKEVDNNRGFLTKIYGFTPIPRAKLLQTPLVLNASTIETFYNLLDYSGSKFIVLSKKDLAAGIYTSNNYNTGNIIHFVLENFRKVFENNSHVVLEVPSLSPPSPEGEIALVYPKNEAREKHETYYRHFYPLSMLALPEMRYNTYVEGDLSAFSKKYVILTHDPQISDSNLSLASQGSNFTGAEVDNSIYFDYVRNGGNLIVIDSANYGRYGTKNTDQGVFSRLFSISPTGDYAKFNSLSNTNDFQSVKTMTSQKDPSFLKDKEKKTLEPIVGNSINISGTVDQILYAPNSTNDGNISVSSYYTIENNSNNYKTENAIVAPFTIEKKYGHGKITYVNANGYFHAIFNQISFTNNISSEKYQSSNKNHYFSTLANMTDIMIPDLAKEDRQFSGDFLSPGVTSGENSRAQKIRQIFDNIQISTGYQARINSSSLLLPIINNSNGDLVATGVTFASAPSGNILASASNSPNKNVTTYELKNSDTVDRSLRSSNNSDENSNNEISLKDAKIRNLKLYGSYEVVVESNAGSKIVFPALPSFSDYVAINFPEDFDMTIKLSDSKPSYAEFEIIDNNDSKGSFVNDTSHRLRIYGDDTMVRSTSLANINSTGIHFLNTRSSDLISNGTTSLIMKSPQFQIKEEVAAIGIQRNDSGNISQKYTNTLLTFKGNLPQNEPIEIMNQGGSKGTVIFRIDFVDSYDEPYGEGKKNHHLSYVKGDIKIVQSDITNDFVENARSTDYQHRTDIPSIKFPGDISERAKKHGIDVPLQKMLTSDSALFLVILIIIAAVLASKIGIKTNSIKKLKSR
jgi:hypothetical protein